MANGGGKCAAFTCFGVFACLVILLGSAALDVIIYINTKDSSDQQTTVSHPCQPNPCFHNGLCSISLSQTLCNCTAGYYGHLCEEENPCVTTTCQNGGTCSISDKNYRCACQGGFSGSNCEIANAPCVPNPCQNNGNCTQNAAGFLCACPEEFIGNTCQTENPCEPNPCNNGGTCSISGGSYRCACPESNPGKNCESTLSTDTDTQDGKQGEEDSKTTPTFYLVIANIILTVLTILFLVGMCVWNQRKKF